MYFRILVFVVQNNIFPKQYIFESHFRKYIYTYFVQKSCISRKYIFLKNHIYSKYSRKMYLNFPKIIYFLLVENTIYFGNIYKNHIFISCIQNSIYQKYIYNGIFRNICKLRSCVRFHNIKCVTYIFIPCDFWYYFEL